MQLTQDGFDYAGYAKSLGLTASEEELQDPALQQKMYGHAVNQYRDDIKNRDSLTTYQANVQTMAEVENASPALGVSEPLSMEQEQEALNPAGMNQFLRTQGAVVAGMDLPMETLIPLYVDVIAGDKYKYAKLSMFGKKQLTDILSTNLQEFSNGSELRKNFAQDPETGAVVDLSQSAAADEEARDAVADAHSMTFSERLLAGLSISRIEQGNQDVGEVLLNDNLSVADAKNSANTIYQNYLQAQTIPADDRTQATMQEAEESGVIKALANDPGVVAAVLAQTGVDLGETIVGAVAGGVAGSTTGPIGTVAGSSAAAGLITANNITNSAVVSQIMESLSAEGLEITPANIHQVIQSDQFQVMKAQARTSGVTEGVFASLSGLVGGGAIGKMMSVARKAKGAGAVVVGASETVRNVGSRAVVAAGIDVEGARQGAKALGQEASNLELAIEGLTGGVSAVVETGALAVSSRNTATSNVEVRQNAVLTDANGVESVVVSADKHGNVLVAAVGADGVADDTQLSTIPMADIANETYAIDPERTIKAPVDSEAVKNYTPSDPVHVEVPETEIDTPETEIDTPDTGAEYVPKEGEQFDFIDGTWKVPEDPTPEQAPTTDADSTTVETEEGIQLSIPGTLNVDTTVYSPVVEGLQGLPAQAVFAAQKFGTLMRRLSKADTTLSPREYHTVVEVLGDDNVKILSQMGAGGLDANGDLTPQGETIFYSEALKAVSKRFNIGVAKDGSLTIPNDTDPQIKALVGALVDKAFTPRADPSQVIYKNGSPRTYQTQAKAATFARTLKGNHMVRVQTNGTYGIFRVEETAESLRVVAGNGKSTVYQRETLATKRAEAMDGDFEVLPVDGGFGIFQAVVNPDEAQVTMQNGKPRTYGSEKAANKFRATLSTPHRVEQLANGRFGIFKQTPNQAAGVSTRRVGEPANAPTANAPTTNAQPTDAPTDAPTAVAQPTVSTLRTDTLDHRSDAGQTPADVAARPKPAESARPDPAGILIFDFSGTQDGTVEADPSTSAGIPARIIGEVVEAGGIVTWQDRTGVHTSEDTPLPTEGFFSQILVEDVQGTVWTIEASGVEVEGNRNLRKDSHISVTRKPVEGRATKSAAKKLGRTKRFVLEGFEPITEASIVAEAEYQANKDTTVAAPDVDTSRLAQAVTNSAAELNAVEAQAQINYASEEGVVTTPSTESDTSVVDKIEAQQARDADDPTRGLSSLGDSNSSDVEFTTSDGVDVTVEGNGRNRQDLADDIDAATRAESFDEDAENASLAAEATGTELPILSDSEWQRRVQQMIDFIPESFRDRLTMEMDNNGETDASIGHLGSLVFNHVGTGPHAFINANSAHRSISGVARTLAHELSHYTTNSWLDAAGAGSQLQVVMEKFYDLQIPSIEANLQVYIKSGGIDVHNATPAQKWLLTHELLAADGVDITNVYTTKNSLIEGIEPADLKQLRDEASSAITHFVTDLTKIRGIAPDNVAEAKAFYLDILRFQSTGSAGNRVIYDFTDSGGGATRTLRVVSTKIGQTSFVMNTSPEIAAKKARADRFQRLAVIAADPAQPIYRRWLAKIRIGMARSSLDGSGALGVGITRAVTDDAVGVQPQYAAISNIQDLYSILQGIAKDAGHTTVDADTFGAGAQRTLAGWGVKEGTSEMKHAIAYDNAVAGLAPAMDERYRVLRKYGMRQLQMLDRLRNQGFITDEQVTRVSASIRKANDLLQRGWSHVRYRAYEDPTDLKRLQAIQTILDPKDGTTPISYDAFVEARARLEALSDESLRGERSQAVQDDMFIVSVWEGLENLDRAYEFKQTAPPSRADVSRTRPPQVLAKINQLIAVQLDRESNITGGTSTSATPDSLKTRSLDPFAGNQTSDFFMRKFLLEVTDPLEVGFYNLRQLEQIQAKTHYATAMAESLAEIGVHSYITQPLGTRKLGDAYSGTLLQFLDVPEIVANEIVRVGQVMQVSQQGMLANFIGSAKLSATVLSAYQHVSNIPGMVSQALLSGDVYRLMLMGDTRRQLAGGTRQFASTVFKGQDARDVATDMRHHINEMFQSNVFGTSQIQGDLSISARTDLIEKLSGLMSDVAANAGVISDTTAVSYAAKVRKALANLKTIYAASEDIVKITRYVHHYNMGILEFSSKANDIDFGDGGTLAHDQYIEFNARKRASEYTRRDTTDYAGVSEIIAKLARNKTRFFLGNFLGHSNQMLRLAYTNAQGVAQIKRDMKIAKDGGHVDWHKALMQEAAYKAAGNASAVTFLGTAAVGASLPIALINKGIEVVAGENDEDDNILAADQMSGIDAILQHRAFYDSGLHYNAFNTIDPATKQVIVWNDLRLNVFGPLVPPPLATTEPEFLESIVNWGLNLFGVTDGNANNFESRLMFAAMGRNAFGADLELETVAQRTQYFAKVSASLGVPAVASEAWIAVMGTNPLTGKKTDPWRRFTRVAGLDMRTVDLRVEIGNFGREVNRDLRGGELKRSIDSATVGTSVLSHSEAVSMAKGIVDRNDRLNAKYSHMIQAVKQSGVFTQAEFIRYVTRDVSRGDTRSNKSARTGLNESQARALWRGQDILKDKAVATIDNAIKRQTHIKDPDSLITSSQEIVDQGIENLKLFQDTIQSGK